jgi:carboxyl-terminal processing protease
VYVRLSSFAPGVARSVAEAIWERRAKKVVLDLRHNPGGLINEGAALLDLFFASGATGGIRPRAGRAGQEFEAKHQPTDTGVPIVVLIDGGTASASELVSMVLKERGRAVIIGSPSIGKGSVQKIIRMPDGGALRVTSAYYTGATGQPLPLAGVRPDRYLAPASGRTVLEGGDPTRDGWVLSALDVLEGGPQVSGRSKRRSFYGPMP